MSERGYFSFRYTIPGFTLILIVVAINHFPLLDSISTSGAFFGIFFSIISLLTGSALGFLIAQIWWFRFSREGKKKLNVYGVTELKNAENTLIEKLEKLGLKKEIKNQKDMLSAISDYMLSTSCKKEMLDYIRRRWDMYHVLSSTHQTMWISLIIGIFLRFFYELTLFNASFVSFIFDFVNLVVRLFPSSYTELEARLFAIGELFQSHSEILVLMIIVLAIFFMLWIFKKVRHELMTKYCPVLEAAIRSAKISNKELTEAFPSFFNRIQQYELDY